MTPFGGGARIGGGGVFCPEDLNITPYAKEIKKDREPPLRGSRSFLLWGTSTKQSGPECEETFFKETMLC